MKLTKDISNYLYNLSGSVIPLLGAIITVPVYLQSYGADRYGVMILLWLTIGYLGFFDLGMGRAVTRQIAALKYRYSMRADEILYTALIWSAFMGLIGGLILVLFISNVNLDFVGFPRHLESEFQVPAVLLVGAMVPISTIGSVISGKLIGQERFKLYNVIIIISTLLFQFVPVLAQIFFEPSLKTLIFSIFFARVTYFICLLISARAYVLRPIKSIKFSTLSRLLLKTGGWMSLSSVISPMMVSLDRYVISSLLGAQVMAKYAITYQIVDKIVILAGSLTNIMFPKFAIGKNADANQKKYLRLSGNVISYFGILYFICVLLAHDWFFSIWINETFSREMSTTVKLLSAGFAINVMGFIPFNFLQARGDAKLTAYLHLFELPFYIVLIFFTTTSHGLEGAAFAFFVRCSFDTILLGYIVKKRFEIGYLVFPFVPIVWLVLGISLS